MFGVGVPEMLIIMVVALLVFGPERLPELARTVGRAVGRVKAATNSIQKEIERGMDSLDAPPPSDEKTRPEPSVEAPEKKTDKPGTPHP